MLAAIVVLLPDLQKGTFRAIVENAEVAEISANVRCNSGNREVPVEPNHTADWTSAGIWRSRRAL
jgi:hypothetical protein